MNELLLGVAASDINKLVFTNTGNNQLPDHSIAQFVGHCTSIAEVTGFKSCSGLNFFLAVPNCDDQSSYLSLQFKYMI